MIRIQPGESNNIIFQVDLVWAQRNYVHEVPRLATWQVVDIGSGNVHAGCVEAASQQDSLAVSTAFAAGRQAGSVDMVTMAQVLNRLPGDRCLHRLDSSPTKDESVPP